MPASSDSTIVAVATPPGQGGIGVVRLSGPAARAIAQALFQPSHGGARLRSHRMVHGTLRDPRQAVAIDAALVCLMAGPRSFTGEDVVEFHCHGSPAVLQRVVGCCLALGARLAERGEFTLRAFLNGRMDLAQAEAVMDLVRARTATAAQVAAQGVTGALARSLAPAVEALTGAIAYLEATIDFVEEDLPEQAAPQLLGTVAEAQEAIAALLRRAAHGALLRDGVRVVLAGKPNVGKSSLLNAILRRDRAIVTAIAGTTRDTLEEAADIHGLPMFLVDTAGLAETGDPVERLGIARSTAAVRDAGIVALVVDAGAQPDAADHQAVTAVRAAAPTTPLLLLLNKCDLPAHLPAARFDSLFASRVPPAATIACSAVNGEGLAALEDALAALALGGEALDAEATVVENARQRHALEEALAALAVAAEGLREGRAAE
ncbi:MAG TPA: tRNA uridine-5-carboxymethylaminomethyl(34) synthesis GTPase MnmE, partial [Chloroflexota bacterium]|nr:tRNA uridine-5-carboxymethylaminomethyl(34) synthesis GTPase MnmE [Chloroflexota bacterium]